MATPQSGYGLFTDAKAHKALTTTILVEYKVKRVLLATGTKMVRTPNGALFARRSSLVKMGSRITFLSATVTGAYFCSTVLASPPLSKVQWAREGDNGCALAMAERSRGWSRCATSMKKERAASENRHSPGKHSIHAQRAS